MLYVNSCAQSCQSFTHLMSSQFSSLMRCVGSSSKSASTTSIPQSTSIIPSADARDAKRKYDSFRACSTQTASLSPPRTAQQDTIPARCCAGGYIPLMAATPDPLQHRPLDRNANQLASPASDPPRFRCDDCQGCCRCPWRQAGQHRDHAVAPCAPR